MLHVGRQLEERQSRSMAQRALALDLGGFNKTKLIQRVSRISSRKNDTKFVELPLIELKKKYDHTWLQEKVVSGHMLS